VKGVEVRLRCTVRPEQFEDAHVSIELQGNSRTVAGLTKKFAQELDALARGEVLE